MFSFEEVACALELVDVCIQNPEQSDYRALCAVQAGRLLGYACYGPVPLTSGTYDLYWIAVDPGRNRRGIGSRLLEQIEAEVRAAKGRMLLAQTSGRSDYAISRSFYYKNGFKEVSRIGDYYKPGEDGLIFQKVL